MVNRFTDSRGLPRTALLKDVIAPSQFSIQNHVILQTLLDDWAGRASSSSFAFFAILGSFLLKDIRHCLIILHCILDLLLAGISPADIVIFGVFDNYAPALQAYYPDLYLVFQVILSAGHVYSFHDQESFESIIKKFKKLQYERIHLKYVNHTKKEKVIFPGCAKFSTQYFTAFAGVFRKSKIMMSFDCCKSAYSLKDIWSLLFGGLKSNIVLIGSSKYLKSFATKKWILQNAFEGSKEIRSFSQSTQFHSLLTRIFRLKVSIPLHFLFSVLQHLKFGSDNPQVIVGHDIVNDEFASYFPIFSNFSQDLIQFGYILPNEHFLPAIPSYSVPAKVFPNLLLTEKKVPLLQFKGKTVLPAASNHSDDEDSNTSSDCRNDSVTFPVFESIEQFMIHEFEMEKEDYYMLEDDGELNLNGDVALFYSFLENLANDLDLSSVWDPSFSTRNWVDYSKGYPKLMEELISFVEEKFQNPDIYSDIPKITFFLLFRSLESIIQSIEKIIVPDRD